MTIKKFIDNTIDLDYDEWTEEMYQAGGFYQDMVIDTQDLIQDTNYHPEIFVLKHTYLVLRALKEMNLPELYEAGLFHDWGKSESTLLHTNGKITSYGHADISESKLMKIYSYVPEIFDTDINITKWIVKRHMDFDVGHNRFKNNDKYDEPYDLLKLFVEADKELSRELFFEEFGYDRYFKNVIDMHMFKFSGKPAQMVKLYLNIGISGSGKSTNNVIYDVPVVSSDNIRKDILGYVGFDPSKEGEVWSIVKERITGYLSSGESCTLDATNVNRFTRIKFLSYIHSQVNNSFSTVGIIYPYVDVYEARRRIEKDLLFKDRSDVPIEILKKQQKNLMDSMKEGFTDLDTLYYARY